MAMDGERVQSQLDRVLKMIERKRTKDRLKVIMLSELLQVQLD